MRPNAAPACPKSAEPGRLAPLEAIAQWGEYDDSAYMTNGDALSIIGYDGLEPPCHRLE
ncbi:MAG: hypothetical protein ACLQVX_04120 [Limisphaerales bacterium]